jgi:NAD dependent epimerase/dehydratase
VRRERRYKFVFYTELSWKLQFALVRAWIMPPAASDSTSRALDAMKNILITGADGFIGSHLTEMMVATGARVHAVSQYNSFNNWGWLEHIPCVSDINVIPGDIRDPQFCHEITCGMDIVFHLAALIAIPFSYRSPDTYVATNIQGTLNICNAALRNGVGKVIHTSTSEVYGTAEYVPIDERHPLRPQSPYSATKIGADAVALSFYHSFKLPLIVARPFNTYGPRQSARAVIPTIVAQLAGGVTEVHLGDITTTRDFTYVEDTCRGFATIAELDDYGEVFNIGSNSEISVGDLFAMINGQMGGRAQIVQDENRFRPKDSEVLRLRCDNSKLFARAGFKPRIPFEEGLRRTIEWFGHESNRQFYKANLYNV